MSGMLSVDWNRIDFIQYSDEAHIEALGTMGSNRQWFSERNFEEAWNLSFHGQNHVSPLVNLLRSNIWLELEKNDMVDGHSGSGPVWRRALERSVMFW